MIFAAHCQLMSTSGFKAEKHYKKMYEFARDNEEWFLEHLRQEQNPNLHTDGEQSCGIIGTYNTILRQRGDLEACLPIMKLYIKVLDIYSKMVLAHKPQSMESILCMRALQYKHYMIRYNMTTMYPKHLGLDIPLDEFIMCFGELCKYEIEMKVPFENQQYVFMMQYLGHPKSIKACKRLNQRDAHKLIASMDPGALTRRPREKAKLRVCGMCDTKESVSGEHAKCSSCALLYYCDAKCQKQHWKVHKPICAAIKLLTKRNRRNKGHRCTCGATAGLVEGAEPGAEEAPLLKCSKCNMQSYCSKDCQTTHWATHKPVCKLLRLRQKIEQEKADRKDFVDPTLASMGL